MSDPFIEINERKIGKNYPVYIIAEMSANHGQKFDNAVKIIEEAKNAGADAVKLQTYTPDTITINCDKQHFLIEGTIWEGRNLYDLYKEAYTPWEWQPRLKEIANDFGLDLFSSPFDPTAVDFLEEMNVPAYKIASFENVDFPLVEKIAKTGRPAIISTGMTTLSEIDEVKNVFLRSGGDQLALLKCTSAYPAPPEEINLRTIPHMEKTFNVPVGLSDHTLGATVPVAAVAMGACIIEKHFTLSRSVPGPDSSFSLEPREFREMVGSIRTVEKALGKINYELTEKEAASRKFRRSLFVVQDMRKGEEFTHENVRSIRPGYGLHTKYLKEITGRRATIDISRGTPLNWDLVE